MAEKYAVRCGGGTNHRMSLSDEALIKDNHIVAAGSITAALEAVRAQFPGLTCEVECDTLEQVAEAVEAGAELILLDNMDVVTTGVDFLSVGALTHSAPVLDIGLDLTDEQGEG